MSEANVLRRQGVVVSFTSFRISKYKVNFEKIYTLTFHF